LLRVFLYQYYLANNEYNFERICYMVDKEIQNYKKGQFDEGKFVIELERVKALLNLCFVMKENRWIQCI